MEERYVLALYEGDHDYLQGIEQELCLALDQEALDLQEKPEGEQELPF